LSICRSHCAANTSSLNRRELLRARSRIATASSALRLNARANAAAYSALVDAWKPVQPSALDTYH
jgi:hypothetical protein